jgi:hypothetical protein
MNLIAPYENQILFYRVDALFNNRRHCQDYAS